VETPRLDERSDRDPDLPTDLPGEGDLPAAGDEPVTENPPAAEDPTTADPTATTKRGRRK
jgi:hypothetical protein